MSIIQSLIQARKVAAVALLLSACGPAVDTKMATQIPSQTQGRIEVTRIGVIDDDLAYGGRRGIYTVVDRKTSTEYIGVSGVGITEVGSHPCGKSCNTHDER